MRILVVDDELVSRTKMEMLMQSFGDSVVAENGRQALSFFQDALAEDAPFDLIMLDIDMPDLKGTDVLQRIRKMEATGAHRARVVMVTAQSDQANVMACLQSGCDDYITKPFNIGIIRNKLKKLGLAEGAAPQEADTAVQPPDTSAEAIFNDINKALRAGELTLPVMPQIGIRFRAMVKDNASLNEMADLLKQDVVVASKLIRVANSAMYRGFGKMQTLDQAIGRLGLAETEQLVTAISNQKLFSTQQPKYRQILNNLWSHSLACAYAAEVLTASLAREFSIDPFTAGMFHDIGALALIQIIAELEKRGHYNDALDESAVCDTVDAYHGVFGAKLLEKWEFEDAYCRIALSHDNLLTAEVVNDELYIIHFANLLSKSMGYCAFGQAGDRILIDTASAKALKLEGHQISVLERKVKARMAAVVDIND